MPFPPPGDLPNPGIEPKSPASPILAGGFFTTEPPGKLGNPTDFPVAQWQRIHLQCREMGSISGSGRSLRGGNGNPLQYSCPGNPMDRGPWWATVHGVSKESKTAERLSTHGLYSSSIQWYGLNALCPTLILYTEAESRSTSKCDCI